MIGNTLQRLMDEKNTNANELAHQIGINPQTLYSIIRRNNMKIDFETLLKICNALDVDVEEFYKDYIKRKPIKIDELSETKREFINEVLTLEDEEIRRAHDIVKFVLQNRGI